MKRILVSCAFLFLLTPAHSLEQMIGKVTYVEATYLPGLVQFSLDSGSPSCPAGAYLKWANADQANTRAVYATLLMAVAAGKRIRLYINDGDAGCSGIFLHLYAD